MKLMDKYLLREHLAAVACCLAGFLLLFVVYDLFERLSRFLEASVPFLLIVRFYLALVLPRLKTLVPASLLLATLYTLWRMSRHNELTAFRACGVGLRRILMPFLAVGILASLLSWLVEEEVGPRATRWTYEFRMNGYRPVIRDRLNNLTFYNRSERRWWKIGRVQLDTPHRLHDVEVGLERTDGSRLADLRADKAEWIDGQWWFYSPQVQAYDERDNPIGEPSSPVPGLDGAIEMRFMNEQPGDFINEGTSEEEYLSSRAILRYLATHPELSEGARAEMRLEVQRRLAMPWACFVVTLFGIPAGLRSSRHSAVAGVFLAIALFLGFYGVMQAGVFLAMTRTVMPWIGAWLPNMVFSVAGLRMMVTMEQ
ncbi:MAG: YjgP/YjgQ family permease [Lentisphaerae bacterium]|nr:YjgP/YjgQ family permease [Lentisphaerota bacterium]